MDAVEEQFVSGTEEVSLDELIKSLGGRVLKLAYYHMRDKYLAEDIAQEVFCRVYKNLRKFRGESDYYTWIYRITVNLCRDYMASAGFRRMLPLRDTDAETSALDETRMFETAEGGEVFQKVMELPVKLRSVISLYYFEDMTTGGIARTLGISESNVRARLCRGRQQLKRTLAQEGFSCE